MGIQPLGGGNKSNATAVGAETGFLEGSFGLESERYLAEVAKKCGMSLRELYEEWQENKYERELVDPVRWLNDKDYFGAIGSRTFPGVKDDFYRIVTQKPRPMRILLKGSIGWGKTWMSAILVARMIYELSCYRSPQIFFGLAPMTTIAFMNLSISAQHAQRVLFKLLKDMIDESPYFQKTFPRNRETQSALEFPQKKISVVPGSSSDLAPLGENLFGGVIEEANFFQVVKGSSKITNPAEREWDHAKKLHDSVWRRMKSRYQNLGRIPGMLILNSSAKFPDDFLERLARTADGSETVVLEHAEWETKPVTRYSGRKFFIFVGDQHAPPKRILEDQVEEYAKRGEVCAIPVEYERDFTDDLDGAIRDILGRNVRSANRFIPDDTRLSLVFSHGEPIPVPFSDLFLNGVEYSRLDDAIDWNRLIKSTKLGPRMLLHPAAPRYAHIDLSSTGDATGFAVVHVGRLKEVTRYERHLKPNKGALELSALNEAPNLDEGEEEPPYTPVVEVVPVLYVDLVVRILPPSEGEIEFEAIRDVLYNFRDKCGVSFNRITYDYYGSRDSQQILKKRFGAEVVGYASADKSPDAYMLLKETINEGRLRCYPYGPLQEELRTIQRSLKTGKVDHPTKGSKDVADALACAVFSAVRAFDSGMVDIPQMGETDDTLSREEKLAIEARDWLLDRKPVKKTSHFEEELALMKAVMGGGMGDDEEDEEDDEEDE